MDSPLNPKTFSSTTANFLKTNYKQTYKNFYKPTSPTYQKSERPQENNFYTTSND